MAYIGNTPAEKFSAFSKQDFTTSATTSYTLDNAVSNANEIALFINHVRQEPTTAYTAAGTALTLTSATTSSDDMYCVYLGKAVQTVNPANGSVDTAQLADSAVETAKINNNAVTSAKMFSGFANGITDADMWRVTSNITSDTDPVTNVERADEDGFGYLGSGMTQSSGVFTFPKTGIWVIFLTYQGETSSDGTVQMYIKTTIDNGTNWKIASIVRDGHNASGTTSFGDSTFCLFDCQDTSTHKCKFQTNSVSGSILGHSDYTRTGFMFVRLGDT